MLTALERGVKRGVWYSLMDKVHRPATLRWAYDKVKARRGSAGIDHQTIAMFEKHLDQNHERLSVQLEDGSYRPMVIKRVWISKPGKREKRPLGIPAVRERVVQTALMIVLEPIFEKEFAETSYGFRPLRRWFCNSVQDRTSGHSLERIIISLNPILKGWFEYFKHELGNVIQRLDGWIRMRLRSILRKRGGRRGCGRGEDHQRYPNAFFSAHGLFSMSAARAASTSRSPF